MNQDDESQTRQREWEFTPIEFSKRLSTHPLLLHRQSTRA